MRWKGGAHTGAGELDQGAVAHELGDPAVVLGDFGLDEVLAQRLQALVGPRLVDRHESAVADDLRSQDRGAPARHQFGPTQTRKRMIGTNGQQNQSRGLRLALSVGPLTLASPSVWGRQLVGYRPNSGSGSDNDERVSIRALAPAPSHYPE